jgi:glycosyltransferase involved in cell wall biosynthesis
MLSVIIPSYKDPLLVKTIESLLENAEGEIEIIAVLDGYWPSFELPQDTRVSYVHIGKNGGMKNAINVGVRLAKGEFIMRTDEHCMFGPAFDRLLTERFKDNWIVYPMRYALDTDKWEIMVDIAPNIYNKLLIDKTYHKWSGVNWKNRERGREDKEIDESMAMQGSCWIMKKSWWEKVIVALEDRLGNHYGDSHEMVFKTWMAGGKLMVNRKTWYAHKHRDFPRTHHYGTEKARGGWDASIDEYLEYYNKVIKPKWKV